MDPDLAANRPRAALPPERTAGAVTIALVLAGIVVPWLNPAAGGPSAVIQPWLIAAAVTLLLWIFIAPQVTRWHLGWGVGLAVVLAALGQASPPVLLAIGGLIVIALSAALAGCAVDRPWLARAIANAWLVAALVSSVLALAQYFGLSAQLGRWVNPTEAGEAFANLRQRNQFASLTAIGLVALLWKVQHGARPSWTVPAAALLAAANAASASRTGAVQIVMIVVLASWWLRLADRRTVAVCVAAVLAYVVAAVLLPLSLQHLLGVSAPSAFGRLASAEGCSSRMVLWGNVLHLIGQKPWLGWGWGELDYAHFATLYPGARFCDILDNAHNLPLHLAVELGLAAAVLACGGFIWWLASQRPWREADVTRRMAWSVLAILLLHSLLEYPLWYGPFQMAFGFSLGLLARQRSPAAPELAGPLARQAVAAVLSFALLFTAWDYHRVSQLYTAPEDRSPLYRDRPLPRMGDSWLFRDQLAFAELSITPLTQANAASMHSLAMELLHYSPEPRVIEIAIQSAMVLHREDRALWLLARYRAAFPQEHESWSRGNAPQRPGPASVKG